MTRTIKWPTHSFRTWSGSHIKQYQPQNPNSLFYNSVRFGWLESDMPRVTCTKQRLIVHLSNICQLWWVPTRSYDWDLRRKCWCTVEKETFSYIIIDTLPFCGALVLFSFIISVFFGANKANNKMFFYFGLLLLLSWEDLSHALKNKSD